MINHLRQFQSVKNPSWTRQSNVVILSQSIQKWLANEAVPVNPTLILLQANEASLFKSDNDKSPTAVSERKESILDASE